MRGGVRRGGGRVHRHRGPYNAVICNLIVGVFFEGTVVGRAFGGVLQATIEYAAIVLLLIPTSPPQRQLPDPAACAGYVAAEL